jgi:hypothetical protein
LKARADRQSAHRPKRSLAGFGDYGLLRRCAMCPIDRSPHGEEILHQLPEEKFLQPKPHQAQGSGRPVGKPLEMGDKGDPDIAHRPSLPERPEQMAVDIEDEEDDPVIDSGPGIADGFKGPSKQRG